MKDETSKYISDKKIFITPFGIDTNKFISLHSKHSNKIVIGTVKTMKDIYGIPYLIRAFAQLIKEDKTNQPIELLLIGGGNQINEYKKMVRDLNIEHLTHFTGQINHDDVPEYLNKLDIYCAPSESESFGVAILEASSCELPVIVSDVGGLPEVVDDKVTGYIIEKGNVEEMKIRLINLIENPDLRVSMGKNGRNKVVESYDWEKSVEIMKHVYRECIEEGKNL